MDLRRLAAAFVVRVWLAAVATELLRDAAEAMFAVGNVKRGTSCTGGKENSPAADVDRTVLLAFRRILAAFRLGIAVVLAAITTVSFSKSTLALFTAATHATRIANVALGVLLGEYGLRDVEQEDEAKKCRQGRRHW